MPRLTVKIDNEKVFEDLKKYREEKAPHLSMNAHIVQAIIEYVKNHRNNNGNGNGGALA